MRIPCRLLNRFEFFDRLPRRQRRTRSQQTRPNRRQHKPRAADQLAPYCGPINGRAGILNHLYSSLHPVKRGPASVLDQIANALASRFPIRSRAVC